MLTLFFMNDPLRFYFHLNTSIIFTTIFILFEVWFWCFLFCIICVSQPRGFPNKWPLCRTSARPELSRLQAAAPYCVFFFTSSAGSLSAGTAHTLRQIKALVSRLRHAKVSSFPRRALSGCQGRRHRARKSSSENRGVNVKWDDSRSATAHFAPTTSKNQRQNKDLILS